MDVHLLVYDLSRGLARQMSMGLLGFQLDAVYHTSIEVNGREYVYDGSIIAIAPESSHLGKPMEMIRLGSTSLPMNIIEDYLDSLRPIFTVEAYDLFHHNCNNFSDTLSNFLVGKGIPEHIANMPRAVLETPMGQMLVSQLTQCVNAGRQQNGSILGLQQSAQVPISLTPAPKQAVKNVATPADLSVLLDAARRSCAVIFFTSATCPPCKVLYPVFEELAQEFGGKATLIKVDISLPQASIIASQYSVHATPTFITFVKGQKENEWAGADPAKLRGNLRLLVEMAHPLHPHEKLRLPSFVNPNTKPVIYAKVPPLDKLISKMGDDVSKRSEVKVLKDYLEERTKSGLESAIIPDLGHLSSFVQGSVQSMPSTTLFTVIDLFRCSLSDPRISGIFAETDHKTVCSVLGTVNGNAACPYALRLVTLQMACNFFSTPLFPEEIFKDAKLRAMIVQLVSSSFLDDSHTSVRVAAASLLFNMALANQLARRQDTGISLSEEDQVELAASVVEAISQEETSVDALKGMLSALGHLVYGADLGGDLADLLRALDAEGTILQKKNTFSDEKLITEVGSELLGKGLRRE
ncbi:thioredoxin protein [Grosmannia clavigera kw1407]|uniref:Thioredoxin protein n=1 Tax=Grosmannia clavigera (strain kw1407 / UAMH 11150) TaxID=655863 RepID=F0XNK7_GROCL|nr:thioredoxin protein [Grosmannia clavigera kw1407]EFX00154.1 thioredoxin protein [Grosmannia clavigera kw1407]